MNRYLNILFLTLILFTSCLRDDLPAGIADVNGECVKITALYSSPQTKTTLDGLITSWLISDKTGVYCAQAKNPGGVVGVKNVEFSAITQVLLWREQYIGEPVYINFIRIILTMF